MGAVAMAAAAAGGPDPNALVRQGMDKFRQVRGKDFRPLGSPTCSKQLHHAHPASRAAREAPTRPPAHPPTHPPPHHALPLHALPPVQNDVEGSVADFDAAMAARPAMRPYLWQRGLSLYYLGQFTEGAQQVGWVG